MMKNTGLAAPWPQFEPCLFRFLSVGLYAGPLIPAGPSFGISKSVVMVLPAAPRAGGFSELIFICKTLLSVWHVKSAYMNVGYY